MDRQTQVNGNKIIAEFMGGTVRDNMTVENYSKMNIPDWEFRLHNFDTLKVGGYKYHTSWDWLMPVVEKIGSYPLHGFMISDEDTDIFYVEKGEPKNKNVYGKKPIENTWEAVIQFIKWYNNQNKEA